MKGNNENKTNFSIFINNNVDIDNTISDFNPDFKKKDYDFLEKDLKNLDIKETNEILKQLENLNLSTEKSFDTTFEHPNFNFGKAESIIKQNDIKDEIFKNLKETENKSKNINNIDLSLKINKIEEEPNEAKDEDNEQLSEFLLKGKISRICTSFQGYSLDQKCYNYLNDFIPYLNELTPKLYKPMDNLFEVYIVLLNKIKQEFNVKDNLIHKLNDISLNNEGYEKNLLKLKKEIKNKEKEMSILVRKASFEKEQTEDDTKSKIFEINSLKKENIELNNKLSLYKNQINKIEADNKALQNKIKYYIIERENKKNNTNDNNNKKNKQEEFKVNNDRYLAIKKLNMSLVYLLKDINKNLCKYDYGLNKLYIDKNNIADGDRELEYEIEDLSPEIETHLLVDENNNKRLYKHFMFNMDIINSKIIDILKKNAQIFQKLTKLKEESNKNNSCKNLNSDKKKINNYIGKKEQKNNSRKGFVNKENKDLKSSYDMPNFYKTYKNSAISIDNNNSRNNIEFDNSENKNCTRKSFLNFYNNDERNIEENLERGGAIDPRLYDNYKTNKAGYFFDKNLLFKDDEMNGAKRK